MRVHLILQKPHLSCHVDVETGRRCRDPGLYESALTFATPFVFISESKREYIQAALLQQLAFFSSFFFFKIKALLDTASSNTT